MGSRHLEPVLLTLNCSDNDEWQRAMIRGSGVPPTQIQRVIVQGSAEADRVFAAWARLKQQRGLPWGGGMQRVWP
jgi:hypothetical protein